VLGFLIVLLASFCFCFQNVIVRILFNEHILLGLFQTGGFVSPTLQNSFLLMLMRMLVAVPLMTALASRFYAPTWRDMGQLREQKHRGLLLRAVGGGVLMFLYLALLYVAIGSIPTAIAIALFFTYPVFTALFSWGLFGKRPTYFRWGVMGLVLLGSYLTLPQIGELAAGQNAVGILCGISAGITYALYTVNAQKSFERFHPVPFTWMSFAITLGLAAVSLLFWPVQISQLDWLPLWIGGFLSAMFTFTAHLLNNIGIRTIGATAAATIGASNPAFTVILAWLTIQERLQGIQVVGALIVTLSVALLSQENRFSLLRKAKDRLE